MSDLTLMINIGKEMERKLNSVGIYSSAELSYLGSKEAFFSLKMTYPNVCAVHLYVLEGAISDTKYNELPDNVQSKLKDFADSLK